MVHQPTAESNGLPKEQEEGVLREEEFASERDWRGSVGG